MNDYLIFNGGFKIENLDSGNYEVVTDFLDNFNDGIMIFYDIVTKRFTDFKDTQFLVGMIDPDKEEKLFDKAINGMDVVFEDGELSSKDPMALLQTIIRAYAIADYVQGDKDE